MYVFVVLATHVSENTVMTEVRGVFAHMHQTTAYAEALRSEGLPGPGTETQRVLRPGACQGAGERSDCSAVDRPHGLQGGRLVAPRTTLVYTGVKRLESNAGLVMLSIMDMPVDEDVEDGEVYILTGEDAHRLMKQLEDALREMPACVKSCTSCSSPNRRGRGAHRVSARCAGIVSRQ